MKLKDKGFWIFEAAMALCAVIVLVLVSIIWLQLSGVWWLNSTFRTGFFSFFEVTYLVGGFIALFLKKLLHNKYFSIRVWIATSLTFALLYILTNDIDNSTEAWAMLFIAGHAVISYIPIRLTCILVTKEEGEETK